MTRLAFVTGLRAESKLIDAAAKRAQHPSPAIFCAGADDARAESGAARLIAGGAEAIVSFGLCGGLDPSLRPGTPILAEAVVERDGRRIAVDPLLRARWLGALRGAGLRPAGDAVLGSDRAIATAAEKSRLHGATHAGAVDMESHGVARAAAGSGIPFLVLRAVADPAERDLPRAALVATAPDGRVRHTAVIGVLLGRPWEVSAMARLARDARHGFAALECAAEVLFGGD